jgi:hypothetical protein
MGCEPCVAVADQVEQIFRAGGYVKTDGWSVEKLRVSQPGAGGRLTATVDITSSPTEFAESATADVQRLEGGSIIELMTLEPKRSSWVLTDLEQQAQ